MFDHRCGRAAGSSGTGGTSRRTCTAIAAALLVAAMWPQAQAGAHAGVAREVLHTDPIAVDRLPELPAPPPGPGRALNPAARLLATASDVQAALPGIWCGTSRSSDDTRHETPNGSAYKIHAIYALPQDATDRFATVASTLQADAFQASALLEQRYGRALRFDLGTSCGPQYLDISVVRLPERAAALAYLAADANALLGRVASDLRTLGFPSHGLAVTTDTLPSFQKDDLVWLEGVTVPPGLCGTGGEFPDSRRASDNANNFGGQLAIVFRSGADFCDSNTVRHEIGHNLGALLPGAPHAFDGAHCDDAYEDTMCYPLAPQVAGGGYQRQFFDYGNDDYWDPAGGSLPRWTVNLSRFVCPDVACNVVSSGATSPLAALSGAVSGLLVSCPAGGVFDGHGCPSNTTTSTRSEVAIGGAAPRLTITTRRRRPGRWAVHLHLAGAGSIRVAVSCRRKGHRVRVLSRRMVAPQGLRSTVRCDGRPEARAAARPG